MRTEALRASIAAVVFGTAILLIALFGPAIAAELVRVGVL